MVTKHITFLQTVITVTLLGIFVLLILLLILFPDMSRIEQPFALVAGWLGIIIGFFFNQQFTEVLRKKLEKSEQVRERKQKEFLKEVKSFQGTYQEAFENALEKTNTKLK